MSTPQEYFQRVGQIVGDDISDGEVNLHLDWKNYSEAQALLTRIRTIQKEMRLLKKEVNATISVIKSEFATARTSVGTSFGEGLAAGLFGRRTMGRVNAARRDDLRRNQIAAVEPYDRVKRIIDQILHQLDTCKGRIELSPEYQIRTTQPVPAKPPPRPAPTITRRYFAFIAEQVKGPYTIDQLHALHDASTITNDTQCCPEGTEEWRPYSHVMA